MPGHEDAVGEDIARATDAPAGNIEVGSELPKGSDLFRALFLAHPDGVALVVKGRIALVNDRLAEMSGYSTQESIGMAPSDFVVTEDQERLSGRISDLHGNAPVYPSSYTLLRKDGSRLPIDAHSSPIEHDGETILISVLRDISERKQAEDALRRSEERFKVSLKNTPIVVFEQDTELRYTWAHNPVPGFTLEDVLGKTDADLLPPKEAQRLTELKQGVLRSGKGVREIVEATIDDQLGYHDITIEPLLDDAGVVAGVTAASIDVTELKQAENALREAEEKWRLVTENSADHLLLLEPDGTILYINRTYAGTPPEEVKGNSVYDFLDGPAADLVRESIQQILAGIEAKAFEVDRVASDGSRRTLAARVRSFSPQGGATLVVLGATDITERKQAEEALRDSEERYRTLYELAGDGFVNARLDGEIIGVNAAAADLLGYTVDEMIGLGGPDDLVAPEVYEEARRERERQLEEHGQFLIDTLFVRKGGSRVPVAVSGKPLTVGGQQQMQLIARDITERLKAEDALRALEEERYRRLLEVAPDGIVIVDDGGVIEAVNARTEEMFGYDRNELVGQPVELLIPERARRQHPAHRQAYTAAPDPRSMGQGLDLYGLRKDGGLFPADVSLNSMRTEDGVSVIAAVRDVTERQRAEESLRESEELHRVTLGNISDAVFITDGTGTFTYICPNVAVTFGYSFEEVHALGNISRLLGEGIFDPTELDGRGEIANIDREIRDKAGKAHALLVNVKRVSVKGGTILYTCRDITERLEAEKALRDSEATNRALLMAMPDMIFRLSRDGTYTGFVPGTAAAPIVEQSEFMGSNIREVIPSMADEILDAIGQALESQETQTLDYELTYDDEPRFFEARISACGEHEVLSIVRDVTARKRAEEAQRESELRFSTAFHDNPVPVAITRVDDGKIIDLNDAFLAMTGHRRAETAGRTTAELGMLVDPRAREEITEAVSEHGTVRDFPARLKRKTGEVLDVLTTLTQIELEGEACFLTTFVDITERKRLEEELQAIRDEIEGKIERQMEGDNPYKLSFREFTVLHLVAAGKADKEIAAELGISVYTVHRHVSKILAKMDSPSRTEAGTRALREGLLD